VSLVRVSEAGPGLREGDRYAAQSGPIQFLTTDAAGNLAAISAAPGGAAVVDNLSTGSSTAALSAQQGMVLDGRVATAQTTANNAAAAASASDATASTALIAASNAQAKANSALQRSGGTMSGNMNMGGNRITSSAPPIESSDVANKGYVDSLFLAYGSGLANVQSQIKSIAEKVDGNTQGLAIAMAMGGLSIPEGKTFALSTNLGFCLLAVPRGRMGDRSAA